MPTTIATKDASGSTVTVATNDALAAILGEVQASPTANTLADRLKTLATLLGGTLTVAAHGVTGSVEVSNDAGNPLPVSGTFWQATQPVSASALPLPAGASTEATLAALNAKVATGPGTAAAAVRVELPTNGTGVVGLAAGTTVLANPASVPAAASNLHAPAANTAAVLTFAAAGAGVSHALDGLAWSYDGDPTGGLLTVTDGGTTVFQVSVTSKGPGVIAFPRPLKGAANAALVVTLAAGGSGVTGKVNALGKRTE